MSMSAPQIPPNGGGSGERQRGDGAGSRALERREHNARRQGTLDRGARLARGLGWLSLGLGLAQIAAPRAVAKWIGLRATPRHCKVIRAIGAREIAAGIGILTRPRPADWIWTRVGHDVTDLALLGSTLSGKRTKRRRVALATAAVAGVTLLDTLAGLELGRDGDTATLRARRERAQQAARAITVDCSPEDAYGFWRDLTNLPRFMAHLESVRMIDERRSRWIARAPAGTTVEWDAEIIDDRPGELITWRALRGAKVVSHGSVSFLRAPGGRGAEVRMAIVHSPPGGRIGAGIARLFGAAIDLHAASDLRRFKQLMEVGEVVQSDSSVHRGPHPAQPPARTSSPRQPRPSVSPSPEGAAR
jgi:uncharacterized membrane protein